MAAPSLSEIRNAGDPNIAFGTSGTGGQAAVVPFGQAVQFIAQASREKQASDQFKVKTFQDNIDNFYKNFNAVSVDGIMNEDYPNITQEYAQLANDLANNMDVIRNPTMNMGKFAELQQREAQLRGKIAQSKQDVAFVTQANDFIRTNPELNTEENQQFLKGFRSPGLGQRKVGSLITPLVYDPIARANVANAVAEQKLKDEQARGFYINSDEATRYKEAEYDKAWAATASMDDKLGRSYRKAAENAYGKMPVEFTQGRTFEDIDREFGRSLKKQDSASHEIRTDEVGLTKYRLQFEAAEAEKARAGRLNELRVAHEYANEKAAIKEGDPELLNTVTSKMFVEPTRATRTFYNKNKKKDEVYDVVAADVNERAALSRQAYDSKGVPYLQQPVQVLRNPDGFLEAVYDEGNNNFSVSDPISPDKFRAAFADVFFPDKEKSKLLRVASDKFKEITGSGTMDQPDAMKKWMTTGNRWSGYGNPPVQAPAGAAAQPVQPAQPITLPQPTWQQGTGGGQQPAPQLSQWEQFKAARGIK